MTVEIEVVEDPARACGAMLVGASLGGGHVVLTGGSTPRAAYAELVAAVKSVGLDLSDTTYWLGDERCVPPDDERANARMIEESLLGPLAGGDVAHVQADQGRARPGRGSRRLRARADSVRAAEVRPRAARARVPTAHTASLFPDQPAVTERSRLVVGVEMSGLEPFVPRVSLTFEAIARARRVVVLVSGASKAEAVAAAFGPGTRPDPHVPSSYLPEVAQELLVLTDPAGASRL